MWQILIHPLVLKEDFSRGMPPSDQRKILKVIHKKLARDPKAFGKPLTGDLKGNWRLRVEDYRVIYSIVEDNVLVKVIKVGIRRDEKVYEEMFKRIPRIF